VFDLKFATNVAHHHTTMLVSLLSKIAGTLLQCTVCTMQICIEESKTYSMAIGYSSDNQTLAEFKLKTFSE